MKLSIFNPTQKLKASLLKQNLKREQLEIFKSNLKNAFSKISEAEAQKESEGHFKSIVSDFLKDTYYKHKFEINSKGKNDLVIHTESSITSKIGVIIEVKRPSNKLEMISDKNPNVKALHEILHYYLQERLIHNNIDLKNLIITNIKEWYIFDATDFETLIFKNQKLKKDYAEWLEKSKSGTTTDFFYKNIAQPFFKNELESIPCTYFKLKDYEEIINNDSIEDDESLLDLYKILCPEHLLKKQVSNDSNSLNKQFYAELLHILGLEEIKEGSKKIIKRCAKPNEGSIIENTLAKLKTKARDLSETEIYDTALELTITWLNRILFLKLLEGQLIKYNNNPDSCSDNYRQYAFLNSNKITDYDELEELFFEVLAIPYSQREASVQNKYGNIPYLNSSLFEPTTIEDHHFRINTLKDRLQIPVYKNTVLDTTKHPQKGKRRTLEYLFEFLEAYDFSDDTKGKIKEESKTIINASVLGLIFEKINGYKDGSFFTPSFITMYMCRESIRRAAVQKFNDTYGWKCAEFTDLKNEIKSIKKKEASDTLNTLRICDPAVGSGHFLVSALNELITIKQDLKILIDTEGVDLSEYSIEIENDELIIKDDRGIPYSYNFQNKESRRIQEILFREKQTILENCLFGVDINPKSVMICRLRLWIELLKNAYYTESSQYKELETLPNIDINIKCGNSLISRFEVKDSVFENIPNFQTRLNEYTTWVQVYKGERDKSAKAQLVTKIDQFKSEFKRNDKRTESVQKEINKVTEEYLKYKNSLYKLNETEQQNLEQLNTKLEKLTQEKKDIESNPIYQNAFEWRFEFPEVLDDKGGFMGFDVVIGNPPYFIMTKNSIDNHILNYYISNYNVIKNSSSKNIFNNFIELGVKIGGTNTINSMIVPEGLFQTKSYSDTVGFMKNNGSILNITRIEGMVFEEANTGNVIYFYGKYKNDIETELYQFLKSGELIKYQKLEDPIIDKLEKCHFKLSDFCILFKGMVVNNRKENVFEKNESNLPNKFLLGNCISKWSINKNFYTDYSKIEIIGGTKSIEKHSIYPRIIIRRTGDFICSAYLEEPALTESTLYSCWSKDSNIENLAVLGILHSKIVDYFIKSKLITNPQAFPQILMTDLQNLPFPSIEKKQNSQISKLTSNILSLKKSNPDADTSDLEAEIDKLVYELYGLSEEEIKVVEG